MLMIPVSPGASDKSQIENKRFVARLRAQVMLLDVPLSIRSNDEGIGVDCISELDSGWIGLDGRVRGAAGAQRQCVIVRGRVEIGIECPEILKSTGAIIHARRLNAAVITVGAKVVHRELSR